VEVKNEKLNSALTLNQSAFFEKGLMGAGGLTRVGHKW